MTAFSLENIRSLVTHAYLPHAQLAFGESGANAIRSLLDNIRLIYQRCPPERLPGSLTVVVSLQSTPSSPAIASYGNPISFAAHDEVGKFLVGAGGAVIIEVVPDGTFRGLVLKSDIDLKELAVAALVYRYDGSSDRILAGKFDDYVPLVSPLLKSNFAVPTFGGLEDALGYYDEFVAKSKCRIIKDVWEGGVDGPRLVLVNKPESVMRDSLAQALDLVLRDVTVKPEHNTDETKPVDIFVSWFASGATALIEVKWLGKSTAISKNPGTLSYTEYGPPRAQAGANQLADYMDREVRFSGATAPRGYLVIFDARRKNTKGAADRLSAADALAYESDVLSYNPDHSSVRDDFAPPVRFFMRPRKSMFAAAP